MEKPSDEQLDEVRSNLENVQGTLVELEGDDEEEGEEDEEDDDEDEVEGEGEGGEGEEGEVKVKKKRKQKGVKRDDGASPDYKVPGVEKIVLDEEIQNSLGILVGVDVTGEHPWKKIPKELILDNIAALGNASPFSMLKRRIISYPEQEILMGYLLDETNDFDEFYLCLTLRAREYCETVSEEFLQKQAQKLNDSVVKQCGDWKPMGSEAEVDKMIAKYDRPLIRIEVRSKFPILSQTDRFGPRNTSDVRDGYLELVPVKEVRDNIFKKRIDAQIQVTPKMITSSAQTVPRFPRNMWTQSGGDDTGLTKKEQDEKEGEGPAVELTDSEKYKRDMAAKAAEKERELFVIRLKDYLLEKAPNVLRVMNFNSAVDIYNLDYPNLMEDKELCKVEDLDLKELLVFSDKRTKSMYVSSIAWHPLHTEFVAVAYVDSIPNVIDLQAQRVDEVSRCTYGEYPVLIWSVFDSLRPKYYFESHSGVTAISLSVIDEYLMIGGCLNGQVVIWDTRVFAEEEISEVLTDEQESDRQILYSGMTWMKKIHDRYRVRTTVTSDIRESHSSIVTDISWVSSHYEFNNYGKLRKLPEGAPRSCQFLSSSQDGTILIWDLKLDQNFVVEENLKTNQGIDIPKVLIFEKSPYKQLKGKFKPIFRIITGEISTRKIEPLVCMTMQFPLINKLLTKINEKGEREVYEEEWPDDVNISGESGNTVLSPTICLSTFYGEYLRLSWGNNAINSNESINSVPCDYVSRSQFHAGIIVACTKNMFFKDIVATVGGCIVAIWRGNIQHKPIAWKNMPYVLKGATWSQTVPSQIFILTEQGNVDIWDFLERSDCPVRSQTLTGAYSTKVYFHKLFDKRIMTVADHSASISIYSVPKIFVDCEENEIEKIRGVFEREHKVREIYIKWAENWYENNPQSHDKYKTDKKIVFQEIKNEKSAKAVKETDEHGYDVHHVQISALPPSLQLLASLERMWKKIQSDGVELAIQIRKALNKAELLFYEKPLRDVEAQKRSKRRKLIDALENRNKIFEESVEILFPEAITREPIPPKVHTVEEINSDRQHIMKKYDKIRKENKSILKKNPYSVSFFWDKEISSGQERCRYLDESGEIYTKLTEKIKNQVLDTEPIVEKIESQLEVEEVVVTKRKKKDISPPISPVLSDNGSGSD